MRHWAIGWAAFAWLLAGAAAARADNIVVNGGFETGDFSGWTVNANFTTVTSAGYAGVGPQSGTYYAALGSVRSFGILYQMLNTTPGQTYMLSFSLASDGGTPNLFWVDWNGSTVFKQTNIPKQGWVGYSFQVTATDSITPLILFERNDPGYLALDNVSVTSNASAAPEPGGFALLGTGALSLAGVAGLRRRKAA
jgi:hypothetical protein